jgi:DNA-binding protein H-NS
MRKPRDFDSALRALTVQEDKRRQLGDLIVATGADALDMETLAGGLLTMVATDDAVQKESWRNRGAAFFRRTSQQSAGKSRGDPRGGSASDSGEISA